MVRSNDVMKKAVIFPTDTEVAELFDNTSWAFCNMYRSVDRTISIKIMDKKREKPDKEVVLEISEAEGLIKQNKSILGQEIVKAIIETKIEQSI